MSECGGMMRQCGMVGNGRTELMGGGYLVDKSRRIYPGVHRLPVYGAFFFIFSNTKCTEAYQIC